MNFEEAFSKLLSGKKVKLPHWNPDLYLFLDTHNSIQVHGRSGVWEFNFCQDEIEDKNWEECDDVKLVEFGSLSVGDKFRSQYFPDDIYTKVEVDTKFGCQLGTKVWTNQDKTWKVVKVKQ